MSRNIKGSLVDSACLAVTVISALALSKMHGFGMVGWWTVGATGLAVAMVTTYFRLKYGAHRCLD
jgi:hypothetical protein